MTGTGMNEREKGKHRPVRMKDIAADLNVSVVTVSKVLRNHADIGEETRERVLKRVKELNYRPSWIARSLVSQRSYTIGLVIPDLMHSFFAEIAKAVSRTVRRKGYTVFIANSEEDPDIERREIEFFLARQVDGLVIAPCQPPGRLEPFQSIADSGVPFVVVDRILPDLKANYVLVDDEAAGELATEHLIQRGCRRIAHIRGHGISPAEGRLAGYRKALSRHRLEAPDGYVVTGGYSEVAGHDAMGLLLALDPRPDGVFCFNDPTAAGAIRAILDAGLAVPNDVAVVGSGNVHYSDFFRVPLSTIDQSSALIGVKAAELILGLIASKRPRRPKTVLLPPKIVVRDSA